MNSNRLNMCQFHPPAQHRACRVDLHCRIYSRSQAVARPTLFSKRLLLLLKCRNAFKQFYKYRRVDDILCQTLIF